MTTVVADTHALVWHVVAPRKLGKGTRRAFAATDSGRWMCHVPAAVLIEAWLLHERGRLRIGPAQLLEALGLTGDPRSRKLKPSRARAVLLVGTRPPRR